MTTTQPAGAQSPTPRTDSNILWKFDDRHVKDGPTAYVSADFARTLERELSAAHAALAEAQRLADKYFAYVHMIAKGRSPTMQDVADAMEMDRDLRRAALSSTGEGSGENV